VESNLENLLVNKGVDIMKKFSKYISEYRLQYFKAKIDFLNNLKMDDTNAAKSVSAELQNATYI
jgi:hypothetical protein